MCGVLAEDVGAALAAFPDCSSIIRDRHREAASVHSWMGIKTKCLWNRVHVGNSVAEAKRLNVCECDQWWMGSRAKCIMVHSVYGEWCVCDGPECVKCVMCIVSEG